MNDEKVLDVPAFDMTDAALNPVQSTAGGKKIKTPRKRRGRADGSIGQATFDAINEMTADGTITKQSAFAAYGERTNTQPGTVSANYYRVARATGAPMRKGRPATPNSTARSAAPAPRKQRSGPPASRTDVDSALRNVLASVETLAVALKQQQTEAAALRRQLDGLKGLL